MLWAMPRMGIVISRSAKASAPGESPVFSLPKSSAIRGAQLVGFKDGLSRRVNGRGQDLPALGLERRQRSLRAVMHAVAQPFVGGGRAVLADFFWVEGRQRLEDDVDFLNAKSVATAADRAQIVRVEDVFNDDSKASLARSGDALQLVVGDWSDVAWTQGNSRRNSSSKPGRMSSPESDSSKPMELTGVWA